MTPRRRAVASAAAFAAATAVGTAATTPWTCRPGRPVDVRRDFTDDEIAAALAHRRRVRPWAWASMAVSTGTLLGLGLSPLGARLVRWIATPFHRHWLARAAVGAVALSVVPRAVTLPFDAAVEAGQRHDGLSTRSWRGWGTDLAKGSAVTTVVLVAVSSGTYALARSSADAWYAPAAGLAAGAVVLASFVLPVVVEPLFNRFTPLPPGPLRDELLAMANQDGVPVREVLVADASRRTSGLNAYVSGLGATRRIVLFDTLLARATPEEARLVVAHELAHAARRDVLHGTMTGALGAASAACGAYVVLTSRALLRMSGATSPSDPDSLPLLLAVGTLLGAVAGPFGALVSRRTEARADRDALELTGEPDAFIAMQRRLAVINLSDLCPPRLAYLLFASHPTAPERIAAARAWAARGSGDR